MRLFLLDVKCKCHEYGHLLCKCPRFKPATFDASEPLMGDKGKALASNCLVDNEGFTQVKNRNKGKDKKRIWQRDTLMVILIDLMFLKT